MVEQSEKSEKGDVDEEEKDDSGFQDGMAGSDGAWGNVGVVEARSALGSERYYCGEH